MSSKHPELERKLKWALLNPQWDSKVTIEPLVLQLETAESPAEPLRFKLPKDPGITISLSTEFDEIMGSVAPALQYEDYTVGWICALPTEMAAARAMLDHQHKTLPARHNDNNTYALGRVGDHNVVIACLPSPSTGTVSAATVAQQMLATFESIRFGLMVGIGGGIPSIGILGIKNRDALDIRLGDVVVSDPDNDFGGVIQYRFGKTVGENKFIRTGTLNKPPAVLRTAVSKLKADHEMEGDKLPIYLNEMTTKFPNMQAKYVHQGVGNDVLFAFDYDHVDDGDDTCSSCDPTKKIERRAREDTRPEIFYGLIASDNNLMRHGGSREKLRKELRVMCVEMEAAGLMDEFPCLVIRGICDYADTHKNKRWQPYAAATAAAYAKELLYSIPKSQVVRTQKAVEATGEKVFHLSSLQSELNNIDLQSRDDLGRTPLHIASHLRDEKLVKEYLQRLTPEDVAQQDVGQFTAFHLCHGYEPVVRSLIAKMRPQDLGIINCYGYTVLDESVVNWPVPMTELLLEHMLPADINRQNISGWTALYQAVEHGREGVVAPLLKKMSPRAVWATSTEPRRETALHLAALKNFPNIAEELINAGNENQIAMRDDGRRTALHIAAEWGHLDIVRALLGKMDADDVWNRDALGETALHKATANTHREVVKLLLSKVTCLQDLTQRNNMGLSVQEVAEATNDRRILELIASARDLHGPET